MKRFTINTLLILLTANVFSETILLKGGLVHQGNGEVATTSDILIADKRIVGVGKNLIIDGNTRVIEVNGLHVTPGLISPMSNLGIVEINSLDVTRDDESNILNAGSMNAIGTKGKASDVNKVIVVNMHDNYYEPSKIEIKKGETVKFVVKNKGELVHEFNIATKEMHLKHQPEMMKMVVNEIIVGGKIDKNKMKEMSKTDHSMSHSHSNSVLLEPNQSAELIWKFNTDSILEAACNIPGHYESGMVAKIID